MAALSGSYRTGDMSVTYPLARSLPVIFVFIITFLLGNGKPLGVWCIIAVYWLYWPLPASLVIRWQMILHFSISEDFRATNFVRQTPRWFTCCWREAPIRYLKEPAAITGVGIYLTYDMVLAAMNYVTNVSYVAAFCQLSNPVGALLGMVLLKEPRYFPKLIGVTIIFVGLGLVGVG
jgi:hypothetical protein